MKRGFGFPAHSLALGSCERQKYGRPPSLVRDVEKEKELGCHWKSIANG
jgi:hypothetical protein